MEWSTVCSSSSYSGSSSTEVMMFPMRSSTYNNNSNPCSVADPENFQGGGVQPKFVLPPPSQGRVVVEDPKMEKSPLFFFFKWYATKGEATPVNPPPLLDPPRLLYVFIWNKILYKVQEMIQYYISWKPEILHFKNGPMCRFKGDLDTPCHTGIWQKYSFFIPIIANYQNQWLDPRALPRLNYSLLPKKLRREN